MFQQLAESNPKLYDALSFFTSEIIYIFFLISVVIGVMSIINVYLPMAKVRTLLTSRKLYGMDNLMASIFGSLTPFCSCSSIPIFLGFVKNGLPLGVTLSFLITSPLVNEVAFALMIATFGFKIAVIYAGIGIMLGTVLGIILGKMKLEKYLTEWVKNAQEEQMCCKAPPSGIKMVLRNAGKDIVSILKKIYIYVIIGLAIGSWIHGYMPEDFIATSLGSGGGLLGVPIAVILGLPLYSNAATMMPILQPLVDKGLMLGTAMALMMSTVGLSLPEAILLRNVMKPKLLVLFFGIVALSIIFVGYILNIVM